MLNFFCILVARLFHKSSQAEHTNIQNKSVLYLFRELVMAYFNLINAKLIEPKDKIILNVGTRTSSQNKIELSTNSIYKIIIFKFKLKFDFLYYILFIKLSFRLFKFLVQISRCLAKDPKMRPRPEEILESDWLRNQSSSPNETYLDDLEVNA